MQSPVDLLDQVSGNPLLRPRPGRKHMRCTSPSARRTLWLASSRRPLLVLSDDVQLLPNRGKRSLLPSRDVCNHVLGRGLGSLAPNRLCARWRRRTGPATIASARDTEHHRACGLGVRTHARTRPRRYNVKAVSEVSGFFGVGQDREQQRPPDSVPSGSQSGPERGIDSQLGVQLRWNDGNKR